MANLNQVRRARRAAKAAGWRMRATGDGNDHHLHFTSPAGRKIRVWYPWEGRVGDAEERDLEDVIRLMEAQATR